MLTHVLENIVFVTYSAVYARLLVLTIVVFVIEQFFEPAGCGWKLDGIALCILLVSVLSRDWIVIHWKSAWCSSFRPSCMKIVKSRLSSLWTWRKLIHDVSSCLMLACSVLSDMYSWWVDMHLAILERLEIWYVSKETVGYAPGSTASI
jgi:hypothetical protein